MNVMTPALAPDQKLIEIAVADLRPAVEAAASVVFPRNTIPILACLRITPKRDALVLEGTNLDAWMRVECPAVCALPSRCLRAAIALDARVLRAALAGADSSDTVTISIDGDIVALAVGPVTMRLRQLCMASDFPEPPNRDDLTRCEVPEAALVKLIDNTSWAMSTEETRYYLNGIYLLGREGCLAGVATDGHRLALHQTDIDYPLPAVIFPRFSVAPLRRMLAAGGNRTLQIDAAADTPLMRITGDGWTLIAKCIAGTYPDYARVIPNRSAMTGHAVINRALLQRIPNTKITGKWVRNAITFDLTKSAVAMKCPDIGLEVETPIEAAGNFTIGLNEKYVRDVVRVFGTVRMEASDDLSVALILTEDPSVTAVLMPMRVR